MSGTHLYQGDAEPMAEPAVQFSPHDKLARQRKEWMVELKQREAKFEACRIAFAAAERDLIVARRMCDALAQISDEVTRVEADTPRQASAGGLY